MYTYHNILWSTNTWDSRAFALFYCNHDRIFYYGILMFWQPFQLYEINNIRHMIVKQYESIEVEEDRWKKDILNPIYYNHLSKRQHNIIWTWKDESKVKDWNCIMPSRIHPHEKGYWIIRWLVKDKTSGNEYTL